MTRKTESERAAKILRAILEEIPKLGRKRIAALELAISLLEARAKDAEED